MYEWLNSNDAHNNANNQIGQILHGNWVDVWLEWVLYSITKCYTIINIGWNDVWCLLHTNRQRKQ